jgi:hypothetical protein
MMKLKYAGFGIAALVLIAMIFIGIHFKKPIGEEGGAGFYINRKVGFETQVPNDWKEDLSFSDWVVFKTEKEPDALIDIKLRKIKPGTTLEEEAKLLRDSAKLAGTLLHDNFVLVGGVNAWEMIERYYYYSDKRERFTKTWNIYLIRGEMLWRISFGVFKYEENEVDPTFAGLKPDFEEFVRTFKFI